MPGSCGCARTSWLAPGVANAFDGRNDFRVGMVALDLLAEIANRHVDGACFHFRIRAPNLFEQFVARNRPRLVPMQPAQNANLAWCEQNDFRIATRFAMPKVNATSVDLDDFRFGGRGFR